jgi:hypothetical protein
MKLIMENWRKYRENNIFFVDTSSLVPTEELGHGKDHDCPSSECTSIIKSKMKEMKSGTIKPLEVCNQVPVNTYRIQDQPKAPKSGISEPVYFVLDGHHRLVAAQKLGIEKLPVFLTSLERKNK